jgi:cellulose synthase (UDP-forming)
MQQTQPLIGLLLSQAVDNPQPTSLLATVETIEELTVPGKGLPQESGLTIAEVRIAIELRFPEALKRQQQAKIQRLLKTLE